MLIKKVWAFGCWLLAFQFPNYQAGGPSARAFDFSRDGVEVTQLPDSLDSRFFALNSRPNYFLRRSGIGRMRLDLRRSFAEEDVSLAPTTCSRMKLVEPVVVRVPATMAITSPCFTACLDRSSPSARVTMSSASVATSLSTGWTLHIRFRRAHTVGFAARA